MRHSHLAAAIVAAAVLLAACGGGSGTTIAPTNPPTATPPATAAEIEFSLNLAIETQSRRRGPSFVSPSTKSVTISVAGQTTTANCANQMCRAHLTVLLGQQTFTIKLYDQLNGSGTLLGVGTATLTVTAGTNTINATYDGVVDHVVVVPSATAVPAAVATSIPVAVDAYDPDGNLIVGPNPYVNASGQAVTLTLSVSNTAAGGTGSMQFTQNSISAPGSLTLSYNGQAMYQASVGVQSSAPLPGALGTATINVTPGFREYDVSAYDPNGTGGLLAGPDGNVWVIGSTILKLTTAGSITSYSFGSFANATTNSASGLALGPDGNMYISDSYGEVAELSTSGQIGSTFMPMGSNVTGFSGITVGPGNVFWATYAQSWIVKLSSNLLSSTTYAMSTYAWPGGLTSAPGGGLMFTENSANNIGFVSAAGVITEIPTADSVPSWGIITGPDGNIWYSQTSHVVKASAAGAMIAEYSVSGRAGAIVNGPDGNMWFVEPYANAIGRITPQGVVTEFQVPSSYPEPNPQVALAGIVIGPDGNIWFSEQWNKKIGVLVY